MSLPRLPLQTMLFLLILRMIMRTLPTMNNMFLQLDLMFLNLELIHRIQNLHTQLNIAEQGVASGLGEIFTDYDAQHFEVGGVRRHGIGGDDPAARAELVGECEFVIVFVEFWVETESHERKTLSILLGHDDEAELFEGIGEVVGCSGEVGHDGAVAVFSETD